MFDSLLRNGDKELELIVDSCSAGANVYDGLDALMDYTRDFRDDRFVGSRIVIPIQIGTEIKQRIFPEFLKAELLLDGKKPSKTREFYQQHQDITQIIETDASRAYKMFFAFRAAEILESDPNLMGLVLKEAKRLAERYTPDDITDDKAITKPALSAFIGEIHHAQSEYTDRWASAESKLLNHNHKLRGNPKSGSPQAKAQDALLLSEQRKIMARTSKELLSFTPEAPNDMTKRTRRFLLQSMYSCNELYQKVAENPDFRSIRHNHGERAIEQFLFNRSGNLDPQPVSLVISNDYKAHPSMRDLYQKRGKNPFFVMGNDGLGFALERLEPKEDCVWGLEPHQQETAAKMARARTRLQEQQGKHVEGKLPEDMESGKHFANYMVTGKIKPPKTREIAR